MWRLENISLDGLLAVVDVSYIYFQERLVCDLSAKSCERDGFSFTTIPDAHNLVIINRKSTDFLTEKWNMFQIVDLYSLQTFSSSISMRSRCCFFICPIPLTKKFFLYFCYAFVWWLWEKITHRISMCLMYDLQNIGLSFIVIIFYLNAKRHNYSFILYNLK